MMSASPPQSFRFGLRNKNRIYRNSPNRWMPEIRRQFWWRNHQSFDNHKKWKYGLKHREILDKHQIILYREPAGGCYARQEVYFGKITSSTAIWCQPITIISALFSTGRMNKTCICSAGTFRGIIVGCINGSMALKPSCPLMPLDTAQFMVSDWSLFNLR